MTTRSRIPRSVALAVAVCAALLAAAGTAALARSGPTATAAGTHPLTAGTPKHPQGMVVNMSFGWHGLSQATQPILTNMDIWFPRGSVYNGAHYPQCSVRTLNLAGPAGCKKASIMGHGTGSAYADQVITHPQITVVNGGANTIWFYTVLNNPARVQEPIDGHLTRLHGGDFAYHLSVTIPQNLRVVAGVPIELTDLTVTAGRANWIATTAPPAGIKVVTRWNTGQSDTYTVWAQDS
jgi:hypothetical protein